MLKVEQADVNVAEEIVSAANIVSHDGWYEVDTDKVAAIVAKHREDTALPLREVLSLISAPLGNEPSIGDPDYTDMRLAAYWRAYAMAYRRAALKALSPDTTGGE